MDCGCCTSCWGALPRLRFWRIQRSVGWRHSLERCKGGDPFCTGSYIPGLWCLCNSNQRVFGTWSSTSTCLSFPFLRLKRKPPFQGPTCLRLYLTRYWGLYRHRFRVVGIIIFLRWVGGVKRCQFCRWWSWSRGGFWFTWVWKSWWATGIRGFWIFGPYLRGVIRLKISQWILE